MTGNRADGSLGVELRSVEIALADGLCDLGGGINSADGLHDWGRRTMSLLNSTPSFVLQRRESTGSLSPCSRVVGDYLLRRIGRTTSTGLLSISPPRLLVDDIS
jgi:hypothetical protein